MSQSKINSSIDNSFSLYVFSILLFVGFGVSNFIVVVGAIIFVVLESGGVDFTLCFYV